MRPAKYVLLLMTLVSQFSVLAQEKTPPGPREADQKSSQSGQQKTKSKNQETPAAKAPSATDTNTPLSPNEHGKNPTSENESHTAVNISAVPRLTVQPMKDWTDYVLIVATVLLVLVGAGQLWFLRKTIAVAKESADAAKKSAEVSEEALHLTQAADVHLESINFEPPSQLTRNTHVSVKFKNVGRTKADQFTQDLTITIPGGGGTHVPRDPPTNVAIMVGSGQTVEVSFRNIGTAVNDLVFDEIMKGKLSLKILGMVRYLDIFGKPHAMKCEATYVPGSNRFNFDKSHPVEGSQA